MKDKLEVGMYCYNKTNRKMGIGKIISFQSNNNINVKYKNDIELVSIGNLEASHNIIDLIEVGDYVNGNEIYKISWDSLGLILETTDYFKLREKDIKSIVTSQQFESLEYKVD